MSATAQAACRSIFIGRIAPAGSRKNQENKHFHGCRRHLPGRHIVSIKDSVLLDPASGTGNFLTNTNNDRIVTAERGNAKHNRR